MASANKRTWKLQEFVAHDSNVNCLALGHKSGRVLATGGDDKKVNLWAVGKPGCIMSLSGHTTPIECVRFNHTEELVCAGSQTGALKVWDLEAAKLVRTLTGHKGGISCIDFHPYGDFLTSGSSDTHLKLWDIRRKGCIATFKGHKLKVTNIKFSPDGQWIASSGEDSIVKVWDLRAGRVLHEFTNHINAVTSVEFHPHEFLLASGGLDRTVHFWDLESFQLVSSEKDVGAVKCLWFNPDGECLFTGVTDGLKVLGWEPSRIFDSLPVGWGKVYDIATTHNQIVGASFHLTNIAIHIVDLKKVQPFGGSNQSLPPSPFSHGNSLRKSFSKEKPVGLRPKATLDVKTIEESASGTDPEEDANGDITTVKDYTEVFKPLRSLQRTPPPAEPFKEPESDADPTEPQILFEPEEKFKVLSLNTIELRNSPPESLYSPPEIKRPPLSHSPPELLNSPPRSLTTQTDNRLLSSTPISRSQSNLDTVFQSRNNKVDPVYTYENNKTRTQPIEKYQLQRQYSCKDVPEKLPKNNDNGIKHSASEANLNSTYIKTTRPTSRKNSFSKSNRNSSIPNVSRIPNPISNKNSDNQVPVKPEPCVPVDIYVSAPMDVPHSNSSPEDDNRPSLVRTQLDRPVGLDLEEFLPEKLRSSNYSNKSLKMSDDEALRAISRDHESTMTVLHSRARTLRMVYQYFRSNDSKHAIEKLAVMDDIFIFNDILKSLLYRPTFWSLDVCVITLPKIHELLQSKYETQVSTGCESLKLIMRNFSNVIRTNMLAPCGSYSVDIPREERYKKCKRSYEIMMEIKSTLSTKLSMPGEIGNTIRSLHQDLVNLTVGV